MRSSSFIVPHCCPCQLRDGQYQVVTFDGRGEWRATTFHESLGEARRELRRLRDLQRQALQTERHHADHP
ncbi:MAG: hypothetical protein PHV34_08840 [Verrucomicrobiae bacterium]|nr:hypothetical protein [Verrucomicrobiae bacterium]